MSAPEHTRQEERMVQYMRLHWIRFIFALSSRLFLLILGLTLLVSGVAAAPDNAALGATIYFVGSLLVLFALNTLVHRLLSEDLRECLITSKRIIYFDYVLFTRENQHDIPLRRVTGVTTKKLGLLETILNYGSLCFETGGQDETLHTIPTVPHPEQAAQTIASLLPSASSRDPA